MFEAFPRRVRPTSCPEAGFSARNHYCETYGENGDCDDSRKDSPRGQTRFADHHKVLVHPTCYLMIRNTASGPDRTSAGF